MMQLEPIESAVYSLIKKYVKRQSIVLEALKDMRPDIVRRWMEPHAPKDISEATVDYYCLHPIGTWGSDREWDYFIHGWGCRLTHKQTGEPIEWDVGNLKIFDKNWFLNHLKWQLENNNEDDDIQIIKSKFDTTDKSREALNDMITPILTQLSKINLLSDSGNRINYLVLDK